jgi:hypothetical protein
MYLDDVQIGSARSMLRRPFLVLLTGGVLGPALPRRVCAGEIQTSNRNGLITMNDYEFVPPEGWGVQRNPSSIVMQNSVSRCLIQILEPRPKSINLEQISRDAFAQMYDGWQFRQTGEKQYLLSTGVLPKGLEYFMMEAEVSKEGGELGGIQDGAALVVNAGSHFIMIAALHASLMPDHLRCVNSYATWRRFFNSFTVRNAPTVRVAPGELSTRIVGTWAISEGLAVGEYAFAANGMYTFGGAFGIARSGVAGNVSRDERYSIAGDQLTMTTPRGTTEQVRIRFEKVNLGGTGWNDRLHMLKRDAVGENEVAYQRR